jgi:hypothetical protein
MRGSFVLLRLFAFGSGLRQPQDDSHFSFSTVPIFRSVIDGTNVFFE